MLVFLDTEFTDFINCDLISIGMVSQCGQHVFYAERIDYCWEWCNPFVKREVIPYLNGEGVPQLNRRQMHDALWQWFSSLPGDVRVASDYSGDWQLLMDALVDFDQPKPPANIVANYNLVNEMHEPVYERAMNRYYRPDQPPHHALADAMAHRAGWLALNDG